MTPRATATRAPPPVPGYLAWPASGQGHGVLVLHAWWGLNACFREVCDRLSQAGFVAFAPDLYGGKVATTIAQAKALRAQKRKQPAYKTLIQAINELLNDKAVLGSSIGVLGFSMGGHWALWLSQQPELPIRATVTFYGARGGDYTRSHASFLGHFAEHDGYASTTSVRRLEQDLRAAGKEAVFHTYPGTAHWFFEHDREDAFDPEAAERAWTRTLEFFQKHLR